MCICVYVCVCMCVYVCLCICIYPCVCLLIRPITDALTQYRNCKSANTSNVQKMSQNVRTEERSTDTRVLEAALTELHDDILEHCPLLLQVFRRVCTEIHCERTGQRSQDLRVESPLKRHVLEIEQGPMALESIGTGSMSGSVLGSGSGQYSRGQRGTGGQGGKGKGGYVPSTYSASVGQSISTNGTRGAEYVHERTSSGVVQTRAPLTSLVAVTTHNAPNSLPVAGHRDDSSFSDGSGNGGGVGGRGGRGMVYLSSGRVDKSNMNINNNNNNNSHSGNSNSSASGHSLNMSHTANNLNNSNTHNTKSNTVSHNTHTSDPSHGTRTNSRLTGRAVSNPRARPVERQEWQT